MKSIPYKNNYYYGIRNLVKHVQFQKPEYYDVIHTIRMRPGNPAFNVDARFFLDPIDDPQMTNILFARHYSGKFFISLNRNDIIEILHVFPGTSSTSEMTNAIINIIEKNDLKVEHMTFSKNSKRYRLSRLNVWLYRKLKKIRPLDKDKYMNENILEPTIGFLRQN